MIELSLGLEAQTYEQFYLKRGIRNLQGLTAPRFSNLDDLVFPRNALIHYLPESETELGMSPNHVFLRQAPAMVFSYSVLDIAKQEGTPIKNVVQPEQLRMRYQKQFRRIRPAINFESADKQENALLIVNYAILQHLYRYRKHWATRQYQYDNLYATLVSQIKECALKSDRQQFLNISLDRPLPLRAQFVRAEKDLNRQTLSFFKDDTSLFLLEIWNWLGEERKGLLADLPKAALERLNLVFCVAGRYTTLKLSLLEDWRKTKENRNTQGLEPRQLQMRFIKFLELVFSLGTAADKTIELVTVNDQGDSEVIATSKDGELSESDEIEQMLNEAEQLQSTQIEVAEATEPEYSQEPPLDVEPGEPIAGIERVGEELLELGVISAAEHRRFLLLGESYKKLPAPDGKGTLAEFIKIDPNLTGTLNKKQIKDLPFVVDKSMLTASMANFDSDYISNVLQKDIAGMVLKVQDTGIAVTDYRVESVKDANNDYSNYAVRLQPVAGAPSTFRFKLPNVKPDGTFKSAGIKYFMRKQRADWPLRKVSDTKVALTSYYGKVFVVRSTKKVDDYADWLHRQLISKIELGELKPTYGVVFQHEVKQPRIFSTLSKRYRSLRFGDLELITDLAQLKKLLGDKPYQNAIATQEIPCIFKGDKPYATLSEDGSVSILGTKELTTVESLLGVSIEKAPVDSTHLRFMGKDIPLGVVLAYFGGLQALLRKERVPYRTVARGGRLDLQPDEYVVRFSDYSLVLPRSHQRAALLIAGFNTYHSQINNYTLESFDQKDVYGAVLDRAGITGRYLRELELMRDLFVDPITHELLVELKEPTDFVGLLYRANELLLTDHHPKEIDGQYRRLRGYERFAGHVYNELVRGVRQYKARPITSKAQVDISPNAVFQAIQADSSVSIVEDSNPIHNLKEKENTTFSGSGGRSERSMVRSTRGMHKNDLGVISDATVDNGTVGVTAYLTASPRIRSLRGLNEKVTFDPLSPTSYLSTSALISPGALNDDMKRIKCDL